MILIEIAFFTLFDLYISEVNVIKKIDLETTTKKIKLY